MESLLQMNKFEVIDMPGMNTLAFLIEKDYDAYAQGYSLLSLEKIRSVEVEEEGKIKKIFNVLVEEENEINDIILLTLTDRKAFFEYWCFRQSRL